jgi:hypothetical protein
VTTNIKSAEVPYRHIQHCKLEECLTRVCCRIANTWIVQSNKSSAHTLSAFANTSAVICVLNAITGISGFGVRTAAAVARVCTAAVLPRIGLSETALTRESATTCSATPTSLKTSYRTFLQSTPSLFLPYASPFYHSLNHGRRKQLHGNTGKGRRKRVSKSTIGMACRPATRARHRSKQPQGDLPSRRYPHLYLQSCPTVTTRLRRTLSSQLLPFLIPASPNSTSSARSPIFSEMRTRRR